MSHWMGVTDANSAGNIHGGTIMKLADEAAALAAIRHARQRVVTVGMDRMDFLVPIYVGELVTFRATVNAAWRSSMEIGVRVDAENPLTGDARHTNTVYLTMVALDADGRPAPVPPDSTPTRPSSSGGCARPRCAAPTASPSAPRWRPGAPRGQLATTAYRSAGCRALKPLAACTSGRQRGPVPGAGCGSCSAEVSNRIPAICTNAWPGLV